MRTVATMAVAGGLMLAAGAAWPQKYGTPGGAAPEGGTPEAATPAAAGGALLGAHDPQGLVAAIQGLGYRATLGTDSAGDPTITSAGDGINYTIYFYGCEGSANCDALLFVAGFDLPNGIPAETIANWNNNEVMGTAYVSAQNDPFVSYYLITTGGLPAETFAAVWEAWRATAYRFAEATGFFG